MKRITLLLFVPGVPATALAQPGKNLEFAQIAFGGGYETVINTTNRGTSTYNGRLTLLPTDPTKPFPALVNGNPVTGVSLSLNPGATRTIRISSGDASAGTLSGFARIIATNRETAGMLEGNLTYYVKSPDGIILDSVGVAPSRAILQAVIPFDDFQTVALALARPPGSQAGTITLTIFNDTNAQIGTANQALAPSQQVPKFLFQYFPGASLARGRVEITSDQPFLATALTFVKDGQASSLPSLPSMKLYEVTATIAGETDISHLYLSIDAFFVTGYIFDTDDGVPRPGATLERCTGVAINGNMELLLQTEGAVIYLLIPGFDTSKTTQSGTLTASEVDPPGFFAKGTLTLKALN